MKRVVLASMISVIMTLLPGSVMGGPIAYMGLYDSEIGPNGDYCFEYSGLYEAFDVWVWVMPPDQGMICSEFSIDHHDWVWVTGRTVNPEHSVVLGDPIYPAGVSVCFSECHYEWTWIYRLEMLTRELETGYIEVRGHPDTGVYQIANCLDGYPVQPVSLLNYFSYVYQDWLDEYLCITEVSVIDLLTINVSFGSEKYYNSTPTTYTVYNASDITDTLHVHHSSMSGSAYEAIVLDEPMQEGGSYVIEVKDYCTELNSPCYGWIYIPCGDFDYQFDAHVPVATRASSWGAIKNLYSD